MYEGVPVPAITTALNVYVWPWSNATGLGSCSIASVGLTVTVAVEDVFSVGYAYFIVPASITFTVIVCTVDVVVVGGVYVHVSVLLVTDVNVQPVIGVVPS